LTNPSRGFAARLSRLESAALQVLAEKYPQGAAHAEIAQAAWGASGYGDYQIYRLIQSLRRRLGPSGHEVVVNTRGGYSLGERVVLS
jgi:DNA-binding winged helix-turn-helix (wHTH) protein